MVGLWSPDPPPEPDSLEGNSSGYLMVVAASDEEDSDEGYEGYEPLSDAEDAGADDSSSDSENETEPQATSAPAECSGRGRSVTDALRSGANCKTWLSEHNENEVEQGSSAGCNSQDSSDGAEAGPSNSRLEMGEQQVADVMAAMANITLPPSAVPQWAALVPEEQWIQHILDRVKLLQNKKSAEK